MQRVCSPSVCPRFEATHSKMHHAPGACLIALQPPSAVPLRSHALIAMNRRRLNGVAPPHCTPAEPTFVSQNEHAAARCTMVRCSALGPPPCPMPPSADAGQAADRPRASHKPCRPETGLRELALIATAQAGVVRQRTSHWCKQAVAARRRWRRSRPDLRGAYDNRRRVLGGCRGQQQPPALLHAAYAKRRPRWRRRFGQETTAR